MDHATLLLALFQAAGLEARLVREINLQPESKEREESAREAHSTVFGLRHNDHTWTEVHTEQGWVPADSALHLFGTDAWVQGRVEKGFVPIYGMIVPLMIVAYEGGGENVGEPVNRTEHYLNEETARVLPQWSRQSRWQDWQQQLSFFDAHAASMFAAQKPFGLSEAAGRLSAAAKVIAALRSNSN